MPKLYLICNDDRALAIVETNPWIPDPDLPDQYENRITRIVRRLTSPIFPIMFKVGRDQTRDLKTFMGETIEDFMTQGFHVYHLPYPFKKGDLINSEDPDEPFVSTFTGQYTATGFMKTSLAKKLPLEYWRCKNVRLVESFNPTQNNP
jgi:hypothetical protein